MTASIYGDKFYQTDADLNQPSVPIVFLFVSTGSSEGFYHQIFRAEKVQQKVLDEVDLRVITQVDFHFYDYTHQDSQFEIHDGKVGRQTLANAHIGANRI